MSGISEKTYFPEYSHCNCSIDDYYDRVSEFGTFAEDGQSYVITRRDTPRSWLNPLVNDRFFSVISQVGRGFTAYANCHNQITRNDEAGMMRDPNGRRGVFVLLDGRWIDLWEECEDYRCTVRPGRSELTGRVGALTFRLTVFVPVEDPCEVWLLELQAPEKTGITVRLQQEWNGEPADKREPLTPCCTAGCVRGTITELYNRRRLCTFFAAADSKAEAESFFDTAKGREVRYVRATLERTLTVDGAAALTVVSGACESGDEAAALTAKYAAAETAERELQRLCDAWDERIRRISCRIPDENLQRFLNVWLKNQLHLTVRYNRMGRMGYRDVMQDAWGNLYVDPAASRRKMLEGLAHMYTDGRCPRQYDDLPENVDARDFADSPVWIPAVLAGYIHETGDVGVLKEEVEFFNSTDRTSVEAHVRLAFDYMYDTRHENGLILMREGDWLDGLTGINKYGAKATSVWLTIAASYAANQMADLYEELGRTDEAAHYRTQAADYKTAVNTVGWDGEWYRYAYFEDGEPIGSHTNLEGKIYLNAQTWAIFSGVCDDAKKRKKIYKAINHHLSTPFGYALLDPPYMNYGARCGRLWRQRPGTFANGAVYNHGSSFKVFADVALGQYDDALDTLQRCLPNHPDNPTARRTSEPYSVGNVYYGPYSERYGMNLFSWFTATPAWLIHGGLDQILGVQTTLRGLVLTPHVPDEWESYEVLRHWRGTDYHISFRRAEEKGIWLDGAPVSGPVRSEKPACEVLVQF